eukprot:3678026-Alexandrium_andersonii.AAC.1
MACGGSPRGAVHRSPSCGSPEVELGPQVPPAAPCALVAPREASGGAGRRVGVGALTEGEAGSGSPFARSSQ